VQSAEIQRLFAQFRFPEQAESTFEAHLLH